MPGVAWALVRAWLRGCTHAEFTIRAKSFHLSNGVITVGTDGDVRPEDRQGEQEERTARGESGKEP